MFTGYKDKFYSYFNRQGRVSECSQSGEDQTFPDVLSSLRHGDTSRWNPEEKG